jgi:hypothetical protein
LTIFLSTSHVYSVGSLNMESTKSRIARRRYLKYFGPFNQAVFVQDHTLVLLDASGLVEEDNMRVQDLSQYEPVKDGPMDFVKSIEPGTVSPCFFIVVGES